MERLRLPENTFARAGLLILVLWAIRYVSTVVYRLYFHPLVKFPGPRAAALSNSWLHKVMVAGAPERVFVQLHQQYGSHAIRIAPNELHLDDVSLYRTIYSQTGSFLKDPNFYNAFNTPHTVFAEVDQTLHKERRKLLNPLFARSGILQLERMIRQHVSRLQERMETLSGKGIPIVAKNAFRCVTVDIITEFAFANSRLLVDNSDDHFSNAFLDVFDSAADVIWDSMYHPTARKIGNMFPKAFVKSISREIGLLIRLGDEGLASYEAYKASSNRQKQSPVVFDVLKGLEDHLIGAEAVDILIAGSDTTAFTLLTGTWHISRNPEIKHRLMETLKEAISTDVTPSLVQLEQIPYLMACVRESLRLAMPVPGRLPRVVPSGGAKPLVVDGQNVPPGTVVGMSAYTMHFSEDLWGPDARIFNPERWLGSNSKELESNLVPFSKGVRSCIGQNLALAELTIMFAMLYRTFDIELVEESRGGLETLDRFTQAVQGKGILLDIKLQQHT